LKSSEKVGDAFAEQTRDWLGSRYFGDADGLDRHGDSRAAKSNQQPAGRENRGAVFAATRIQAR